MAELVNLRNFRKQKARDEKEAVATTNRAAYGRTKTEKLLCKAEQELETKRLDDHKRDD